jgi:NAD(P)H-dependent FMN reductase
LRTIKILGVSGSLRAASLNTALLQAVARLAPPDIQVSLYRGIGSFPLYNPDIEEPAPPQIMDFRAQLRVADGVLLASPEYAHGVTGAMKNALDWVVGCDAFVNKPVALLNASSRATHAQVALSETIAVMSGRIVEEASIAVPILGSNLDESGIVAHPEISKALYAALLAFRCAIERYQAEDTESGGQL